jgi:mono/diheme cytochrome c family protein
MTTTCNIPLSCVWLMLSLHGCQNKEQAPEERTENSPASTQAAEGSKETKEMVPANATGTMTPTVEAHMKEHFDSAREILTAIVAGDLKQVNEKATWLSEHELGDDLKQEWRSHADAMKNAAKTLRDASTVEAAADGMGQLGQACAECHQALGRPKLSFGEPPQEGSGAQPHMLRHQWAADRLWEGLMAPADEAWLAGSEAMADAPLEKEQLAPDQSIPEAATELAKKIHNQANRARTEPIDQRARAYGEMLGTCANCHRELGVRVLGTARK